jgi:hypothetical protein
MPNEIDGSGLLIGKKTVKDRSRVCIAHEMNWIARYKSVIISGLEWSLHLMALVLVNIWLVYFVYDVYWSMRAKQS